MSFFLRYVVVYIIGSVVLLGLVAYTAYGAGFDRSTWIVVGVFALWIFGYHGTMLWLDYRRMLRLIVDLRAGKFDEQVQPDNVRESVRHLAVHYGGVPHIVAGFLVQRILTDALVRELAVRLRNSSNRHALAGAIHGNA